MLIYTQNRLFFISNCGFLLPSGYAIASMTSDVNASRVGTVLTLCIIPIPLMVLATGLRLYVKLRRKRGDRIAIDDILITLATVCGTPTASYPTHHTPRIIA